MADNICSWSFGVVMVCRCFISMPIAWFQNKRPTCLMFLLVHRYSTMQLVNKHKFGATNNNRKLVYCYNDHFGSFSLFYTKQKTK